MSKNASRGGGNNKRKWSFACLLAEVEKKIWRLNNQALNKVQCLLVCNFLQQDFRGNNSDVFLDKQP